MKKNIAVEACCQDTHGDRSLSVDEARERLAASVKSVSSVECVAVRSALNRILAAEIISPIDVPSHTNSAMDGYAVRGEDLPADGTAEFDVTGTALAGSPYEGAVGSGETVRIMTGAVIPDGADTVIMQEHVERENDRIRIDNRHRTGQNVRQAGEDITTGATVLHPGKQLIPADLGLIASLGIAEVKVLRPLRVAFFSTGDELRSIGEPLGKGDVYDSNRYTIFGMLSRLGVEYLDMGVVRDTKEDVENAFSEAAENADAIVTSGGVSVGEADYVTETLDKLGTVNFWKIAMKPGRPLAFGNVGDAAFFGLPGNPVSVMVTFYQFVRPTLQRMMGNAAPDIGATVHATCLDGIKKRPGRTEFQRGFLEPQEDGGLAVRSTGKQGSGILSSMSHANCFIVLDADTTKVEPGETVTVQLFRGMV